MAADQPPGHARQAGPTGLALLRAMFHALIHLFDRQQFAAVAPVARLGAALTAGGLLWGR